MWHFTNLSNQHCPGHQWFFRQVAIFFLKQIAVEMKIKGLMKFKYEKNIGINIFTVPVRAADWSRTFSKGNEFFLIFLLCDWDFELYQTWMVSGVWPYSSGGPLLVDPSGWAVLMITFKDENTAVGPFGCLLLLWFWDIWPSDKILSF